MRQVYFLPDAEADLRDAWEWYDKKIIGLGDRFMSAVAGQMMRVSNNPEQFPIAHANLRRAIVKRFPYAVYFRVEVEGIYVVACVHTSRNPRHWQQRTS